LQPKGGVTFRFPPQSKTWWHIRRFMESPAPAACTIALTQAVTISQALVEMKVSKPDFPARALISRARPVVIGHRGCCAIAPENTLPSFKLGLDAGADLIELDYHLSKDGIPIVIHDATFDRTTDARKRWGKSRLRIGDRTADEIAALDAGSWFDARFAGVRVPRLAEALEFIQRGGGVPLIEHKSGRAETCVKLLRERGWINRVVVISFDWSYLREFHQLEPRQLLGALGPPTRIAGGRRSRVASRRLSVGWLDRLAETGAKILVWNRLVSEAAMERAHRRGLKVWVYTVNDPELAIRLAGRGADGIITNEVAAIRKAMSSMAGSRS